MVYEATTGTVFDIQRYSLHDGPGIRTVVFLKGCPLRCQWCCNPESWKPEPQLSYMPMRCIGCGACVDCCAQNAIAHEGSAVVFDKGSCIDCGACAAQCYAQARLMVGRRMSVEQVLAEVMKDRKYYEASGGGITLSGGEACMQWRFAAELLQEAKKRHINTAVETTGHAAWEHLWAIAEFTDLMLFDLKHSDSEKHRRFTGVGNELICNNLRKLVEMGRRVIIRIPLIPGFNDDVPNLQASARLICDLGMVSEVHILPYHQLGISKYALMNYEYPLRALKPPEDDAVRAAARIFTDRGLHVQIHG